MDLLTQAIQDDAEFALEVQLVAGAAGLGRRIDNPRVQKPGLALAGFTRQLQPNRVQVLGKTELRYLESLSNEACRHAVEALVAAPIACVVVTSDQEPPPGLLELADAAAVPLFCTPLRSSVIINRLHRFLDEQLAPEVSLHAVFVDVFGVGVLITGPSGIGKSECALDLVLRGHRLVADDVVVVRRVNERLVGRGGDLTRHHMEVRGLGIINVKDLFGAAAVRAHKYVEILVEMVEWNKDVEFDRMGIDDVYEPILEVSVPKVRLPIRPGRNVASIVEVAARNHLLKLQGHHGARELQQALERRLAGGPGRPGASE